MHSATAHVGLSIGAGGICFRVAGRDFRVVFALEGRLVLHPIEGGCWDKVLNDGAVDSVFERRAAASGRRFRDERAEDGVL